jgi:hypothetical protein
LHGFLAKFTFFRGKTRRRVLTGCGTDDAERYHMKKLILLCICACAVFGATGCIIVHHHHHDDVIVPAAPVVVVHP